VTAPPTTAPFGVCWWPSTPPIQPGLVVLPVGGSALGEEKIQGLLKQIDCLPLAVS
jgi:hypothetical protein